MSSNRLITADEFVSDTLGIIKRIAREENVPQLAVGIFFGAMVGAPIAEADLSWAADQIVKAKS